MLKIDLNSLIGLKILDRLIPTVIMLAISVLILTTLSPIVTENLAAPNHQATGTLRGEVWDVIDSNSIPSALIEYIGPEGLSGNVRSNKDGQFEIFGLVPGKYTLTVSRKGYLKATHFQAIIAAGKSSIALIRMREATDWLQLDGKGYAVASHKDVLNIGSKGGLAIGLWFYLNRHPGKNECWILVAKPDSYAIQIMGAKRYNALDFTTDKIEDEQIALVWTVLHVEPDGTNALHFLSLALRPDENIFQDKWYYIIATEGKDGPLPSGGKKDYHVFVMMDLNQTIIPQISREQPYKIPSSSKYPLFAGGIDNSIQPRMKIPISPSGYFDGRIDELRISDNGFYPISGDDIIKYAISSVNEHTVAMWHFNDGAGSTKFLDASQNGCIMHAKRAAKSVEPKHSE